VSRQGPVACTDCINFAVFRPPTQALAAELGASDEAVVSELSRVMQEERERQDVEAMLRLELLRTELDRWPLRPVMSDYCALREEEQIWLVHEIKNAAADCGDHKPGLTPKKTCSSCHWRREGGGPAKDEPMMLRYRKLMEDAAATGRSGNGGFEQFISTIGAIKRFEIAQALDVGHIAPRPPLYLAICANFSSEQHFVPCAVQNPLDRCSAWVSADKPPLVPGQSDWLTPKPPVRGAVRQNSPSRVALPRSSADHGLRYCPDCQHYRPPRPLRAVTRGRGLSPGLVQAATEEVRLQQQLREAESQRMRDSYLFDREPQFQPWCAKFTLTDEKLQTLTIALGEGDVTTDLSLKQEGFKSTVDPANGKVRRVYDLCARRNPRGLCPHFEASE
jgi:hypothetical protein